VRFLFFLALFLFFPVVAAQGSVSVDRWQASVSYNLLKENLDFNFLLTNNMEMKVVGIELIINAKYADYIPEEERFENETFTVKSSAIDDKSKFEIIFSRPIEKGASREIFLKFSTEGLTRTTNGISTTTLSFSKPTAILEDGSKVPVQIGAGTIKVHFPVGQLPVEYEPEPWRELWQGVSGFEDHFVAIFEDVTITQQIIVKFREEPKLYDIIEADGEIEKLTNEINFRKSAGEDVVVAENYVDRAKTTLGESIDNLVQGNNEKAEVELEAARRYITIAKVSLGLESEVPSGETKEPAEKETKVIPQYLIFSGIILSIIILSIIGGIVIRLIGKEEGGERKED
jgi:hypothetical protein